MNREVTLQQATEAKRTAEFIGTQTEILLHQFTAEKQARADERFEHRYARFENAIRQAQQYNLATYYRTVDGSQAGMDRLGSGPTNANTLSGFVLRAETSRQRNPHQWTLQPLRCALDILFRLEAVCAILPETSMKVQERADEDDLKGLHYALDSLLNNDGDVDE